MSDIYINEYIVGDFDIISDTNEYDWEIGGNIYSGTLYDFIEYMGFLNNKFYYHCPMCNIYFSKTGSSIRDRGLYCRSCTWKKKTEGNHNIIKSNSIADLYPDILSYWDSEKNSRDIRTVTSGEHTKFWFKCSKGHSYSTTPAHIISCLSSKYHGCPMCSGQSFCIENSVKEAYSEILPYWDYDKNTVQPSEIKKGTKEEFWFKCDKGHSFIAKPYKVIESIRNGSSSKRCPYCSGKRVSLESSFGSRCPEKLIFWDYTKNKISPYDIAFHTESKYWFICDKGHSFLIKPHSVATSSRSGCRVCAGMEVLEGYNDLFTTDRELVINYWDGELSRIFPTEVTRQSVQVAFWKCTECGRSYEQRVDSRVNSIGLCPKCVSLKSTSEGEKEVLAFIKSLGFVADENVYIDGYNYDIVLEDLKLVVEYNGIYYHSDMIDRYRDGDYNKLKLQNLINNGYKLYVVWEDDWKLKNDICKEAIMRKFGVSNQERLNARDLSIHYSEYSSGLLEKHHIQGNATGCNYIYLVDNLDNVVAELAYRVTDDGCYIVRYATSCIVRGGFGKVLNELFNISDKVYTFSDNSVSDGGLYKELGFIKEYDVKPDYMYVQNNKRVHKFNFRLNRFKKDDKLKYLEGLTEGELAKLNGLRRVYDYGKVKWVKVVSK